MDVKKIPQKKKMLSGRSILILTFIVSLAVALLVLRVDSVVSITRDSIVVGNVKQGNLEVIVEGYGYLESNNKQLITSLTQATVKDIILKPGATVEKDSVIVVMENPELSQEVLSATQDLEQAKGNLRQLKLNQKREALNEEAEIAQLRAQYESARLKRTAEERLLRAGIVAELTFKDSLLTEKQLKERIDILQRRKVQLITVHEEAINIQQEKIKQLEGSLAVANNRLEKLRVRAGMNGVLQTLSVELGQSLSAGQEIALIGSVDELVALVKIPQNQANKIEQGQIATIDTRQHKINGTVKRIEPIVTDGTVEIEISLPSDLPSSARPKTRIDAQVKIEILKDILYIDRPSNIREYQTAELYLVNKSAENAEIREIKFGARAGEYIEITSGATLGESYILSGITENQKNQNGFLKIN